VSDEREALWDRTRKANFGLDAEIPRSVPSQCTDRGRGRSRSPSKTDSYRPRYENAHRPRSRSPPGRGHRDQDGSTYRSRDYSLKYDNRSNHCRSRPSAGHKHGSATHCDPRSLISYADDDSIQSHSSAAIDRPGYVSMDESCSLDYREFSRDEFKPGTIIRAPIHEEDFRRTSPSVSNLSSRSGYKSHVSHTDFGAVYSENRLFIVVQQFKSHYLAIPLFTYQGTGLRKEHDVGEYASIEDHRYPGSSLRAAKPVLATGELQPTVKPFRPESVAHLTYPVSRKYNLHVAYQGRLRREDTECLVKLFQTRGSL